jgi:hypothetical protein
MPFIGACISALAIAWSKARATSFRDMLARHGVSSKSCQWGSGPGMFHRAIAALIPLEFRAATILAPMSFLSSSDKAVQSRMAWSITRLHHRRKGRGIQTVPLPKAPVRPGRSPGLEHREAPRSIRFLELKLAAPISSGNWGKSPVWMPRKRQKRLFAHLR